MIAAIVAYSLAKGQTRPRVALVYVLSIPDFAGAASKVAQRDGRLVEMYLLVAVVFS